MQKGLFVQTPRYAQNLILGILIICLVIDVGGTTTDIAMIENGQPVLSANGCAIDSWTTHMESVDMFTGGIGGDSLVEFHQDGSFGVGPNRVIPLSMSENIPSPEAWLGTGSDCRCIALNRDFQKSEDLPDHPILKILYESGSATLSSLMEQTRLSGIPLDRQLEKLARKLCVEESGFTPTDALNVLNHADFGNGGAAKEGAEKLAGILQITADDLCKMVLEETENMIRDLIITYIITRSWGNSLTGFLSSHREHPYINTEFSLKIPLIGIGAAAKFFLPGVARKLSTSVSFPSHSAVGNAVGAAWTALNQVQPETHSSN